MLSHPSRFRSLLQVLHHLPMTEAIRGGVELARVAQLGRSRFKRAFRNSFGTTLHKYVIRRRIDRAQALMLDSPDSPRDIALASGFAHEAHMSDVFHGLIGQRPAQWHRVQRAGGE